MSSDATAKAHQADLNAALGGRQPSEHLRPAELPGAAAQLPLGRFADRIVATRVIPPREARYADFPASLHPALQNALQERGIERLYCHQAEAFEAARNGEHVVVTTGTASGKSLSYLLPVLQAVLENPAARAILLFPTKALSHDQLRGVVELIHRLVGHKLEAGVYDGDTPPAERTRIRDRAHLILTNPDMLSAALLPAHGRQGYAHLFRNVEFIVVDELHSYRGAFGSHLANLFRRLLRICAHYGSKPQFLCSSATIANAKEHAETICHQTFRLVHEDGSPSAGKVVHFWQPPLLDNAQRKLVSTEMAQLVPHLIAKRHKTIAFCRSRKETEIVLKESRDRLRDSDGHDESYLLAGYRGGYTPKERREVEQQLVRGQLLGVISTNALELGIDIGALQVVVQGGFPGTRASFWQQMGRAGRRGEVAHAVLILAVSPTDQYIAEDPDWLIGQPAEHAVVDRDNLAIQLAHVRAAAAELPLTIDDALRFPDLPEMLPVLTKAGEVRELLGAYHWQGGPFPAGDFSLRNVDKDRFKLVNRNTGMTLTEMDRPQVYREAHPRAVYLHDGVQYLVEALDLVNHAVTVVEVEQNFYTQPDVRTQIDVLLTQEDKALGQTHSYFGDIRVDEAVVGYKMLEFHNHQNLGYEALHEPLRLALETEGVWLRVPEPVLQVLGAEKQDALLGMVHALTACARLKTMAEHSDLRGTSFHYADEQTGKTTTALVCHDTWPGGLGYAAKAFDHLAEILDQAIWLVQHCRCAHGCPACVGDWVRDRRLIQWALQRLRDPLAAPDFARSLPAPVLPDRVLVPWEEVSARWADVVQGLRAAGQAGSEVLGSASVRVRGADLVVTVGSAGLAQWVAQADNLARLREALDRLVAWPSTDGRLVVEALADGQDRALVRRIKLQRRHDDLVGGKPTTEREANAVLAGGYLVAGDDSVN